MKKLRSGKDGAVLNTMPFSSYIKASWPLYIMVLPGIISFIIFSYLPMYGLVMAFQNFKPALGYFNSPWIGFRNFERILTDPLFMRAFKNTLILGLQSLLIGFPAPILLALLFNEVKHSAYKRLTQTISYMPYFISTVIVIGIIRDLLGMNDGVINNIIASFGGAKISFFAEAQWFRPLYIISGIWQGIGYSSIIYLAAISGINPELYEAAVIDGAGRIKRVAHITIPGMLPTVTILLIFAVSGIIGSDFHKILLMYSPITYSTSDVISTYVYRVGLEGANPSYASAVGLFNSVIALFILAVTNLFAKKVGETSLW